MDSNGPFDALPVWALFALILLLVLVSVEAGIWLGMRRRALCDLEQNPVSAMVGAALGLLAFMLAFTFSLAADRYETRRNLVLEESNAIGTTWLRASTLPEHGDEVRKLLRDYVDTRVGAVASGDLRKGVLESERIQGELWAIASDLSKEHPRSVPVGLFVETLNDTIDLHSTRVHFGFRSRLPGAIWWCMLAVTVTSLFTLGYHSALVAGRRPVALVAVMLAFVSILGLIADLDRPIEGMLRVSQQSMIDLQTAMHATP